MVDCKWKYSLLYLWWQDEIRTSQRIFCFLHFEIMKFLKSLNVKYYDLCGIIGRDLIPDPTWDGFTKFKLSLGGSEEQLDPGVDIILNKRKYLFSN